MLEFLFLLKTAPTKSVYSSKYLSQNYTNNLSVLWNVSTTIMLTLHTTQLKIHQDWYVNFGL